MRKYKVVVIVLLMLGFLGFVFLNEKSALNVLSSFNERTIFGRLLPHFPRNIRKQHFEDLVTKVTEKSGTYAIFVKNINNNDTYNFNETELFYAASLYKTPMAVAVYNMSQQEEVSMQDVLTYTGIDITGGTGTIYTYPTGSEFTLDFVLDRLLKDSDNIAQNMLTRYYGSERLKAGYDLIQSENKFFENNTSSVLIQAEFYEKLLTTNFLNNTNKEILLNKMAQTSFDDRIHQSLKEDIRFSHKIGNWGDTGSWHDCGIASKNDKKVVVCVMSRYTTHEDFLFVTKEVGNFANMFF